MNIEARHMKQQVIRALCMAALVACTEPNPLYCGDGECSDPAFPYCDEDGIFSDKEDTCVAVTCSSPGAFVMCSGDQAVSCDAAMTAYEFTPCVDGCNAESQGCNLCTPNGAFCTTTGVQHCGADGQPSDAEVCNGDCLTAPEPHCEAIAPRYLPDVCDSRGVGDTTISASATLGTDLDAVCTGGVVQQAAGPEICVIRSKRFALEEGVTLKAVGNRAVAIVVDEDLTIAGTLDVSADAGTSGPGGGTVTSGGFINAGIGGGGAGFKTNGAAGGSNTQDGGAQNGGSSSTNPALLAVLVGGASNSGGGGGALMLISCRGTVVVGGMIDAGGGGGFGGFKPGTLPRAGAGGGSGGNVVLQGLDVTVTGKVFANGGGGGAGYTGTVNGNSGADGSRSASFAALGGTAQASEGAGGNGGIAPVSPTVGGAPSVTAATPGGGGASVGFIQVYAPSNVQPTLTPSEVSPTLEPVLHIETH